MTAKDFRMFPVSSGDLCRLLIIFANSFDQDQAWQIKTVWHSDGTLKDFFLKKYIKKHVETVLHSDDLIVFSKKKWKKKKKNI